VFYDPIVADGRDTELIAEELSELGDRVTSLENRVSDVLVRLAESEKINARLEAAALRPRRPCKKSRGTGMRFTKRWAASSSQSRTPITDSSGSESSSHHGFDVTRIAFFFGMKDVARS
jgi:hypothetical protein